MIWKLVFLANWVLLVLGCKDTVLLQALERRARNYKADGQNDPYVNDYILTDRWYSVNKLDQQYLMPDSNQMPDYFFCGGYEPIYIKDTHPNPDTLTETPVDAVACLRSTFDDCEFEYKIQIRKCDGEVEYFLVSTKQHSSYCFDPPELQGGDGNFSPPPTDADLGTPKVIPTLHHTKEDKPLKINGDMHDTINYTPYIKFTCEFQVQSAYFYAVNWYLNGNVFRVLGPTQTIADLFLYEDTFIDNKIPLGFTLKCGVRVLQDATGQSTSMVSSPGFFAGIKILTSKLDVPKNGEEAVQFQLTVPLGCRYNSHTPSPACSMGLNMFDPNGYKCDAANVARIKNSHICGQDLTGLQADKPWNPNEVYYFNVTTIDESYEDKTDFTLQLKTDEITMHKLWSNYAPDNIQVVVKDDKTYTNKFCYSRVDPHMKTADGYHYENQKNGEYLLYRNTKYGIEVLEKTNTCNHGRAVCVCGLIVRAGADVYAINLCGEVRFMEFLSCKEGGILKVVHNEKKQNYQIYTPIGTWIDVKLHGIGTFDGFMNVDIMMSPKDVERTEGLCGYMDGNKFNDLKRRDGSKESPLLNIASIYHRHHNTFSNSWRLTDDENLFKTYKKEFKRWEETNSLYCVCEQAFEGSTGTTGRVAKAVCSPSQYLDCHLTPRSFTSKKCNKVTTRRKRSIRYKEDMELQRLMSLAYQSEPKLDRLKREVQEQNISESEAETICGDAINGSMIVSELPDSLTGEDPNAVISQCMFDVMAGNDKTLAIVHVDAINSAVEMKFKRDPEYVSNNTEKVKTFVKQSCPRNCSDRGQCSDEGFCICDKFYHGSDCALDEREPVLIDDMEGGGLCNLTDGDGCECFYIRTRYLLQNFSCEITATVRYIDGSEENKTFIPKNGEYEDMFTGLCCIPEEREERSVSENIVFTTRYDTSVSNDGINFGPAEPLHVFSSECQDALPDEKTGFRIVLKSGFCFIDGMCVANDETQISDNCFACDPEMNKYNWTQGCKPTDTDEDNLSVILGATFGSLVGMFVLVGLFMTWYFKIKPQYKKRKSVGDSQTFSSTVLENNKNMNNRQNLS